jgi:uncharacterized protein (TIGR04255 family)
MPDLGEESVRFRKPPAVETLQGVFFRPLPSFSAAHQGLLWGKYFRTDFPSVEEKNRLEEIIEPFGSEISTAGGMGIRVSQRPESPRLWARSNDGTHVLQIQQNAMAMNWLRLSDSSTYVDYGKRNTEFRTRLSMLAQFLSDEQLGECQPTSCLMTYINHIDVESLQAEPSRAADLFTFICNETNSGWLPSPDQLAINVSYPMPDERGRLHVQINPAVKATKEGPRYVMRFELTARGKPRTNTIQSALEWLDVGHKWIVRGFVDITHPSWHAKWEREQ